MRKFLVFQDGTEAELSPLTYEEFVVIDIYEGSSKMAYRRWVKENGYVSPDMYSKEELETATLKVVSDKLIRFALGCMPQITDSVHSLVGPLRPSCSILR